MPRPKTEAAAYLDIYKLVTERKRLEQELDAIEQRRDRIIKRLEVLNQQTAALDLAAQQLRAGVPEGTVNTQSANAVSAENFNTLFLEY